MRNYKDLDNEKLQRNSEEAQRHIVSAVEDVEDSVYLWETMFKDIIESNIKRRNVKVRHKSLPWINIEIRKAMNQRYKCLKAAQGKPHDSPSGIYTELKEMLLEVCTGKLRPLTGLGYLKNLPHLKISGKYPIVYLVRVKVLKLVPYKTLITLSPRVPLFCSYHILTSSVIYY